MQQPHNTAPVVAVVGSGVWGAAFGGAIAGNASLIFWDKDNTAAQHAASAAGNSARAEADLSTAINAADLIILSVSSAAFSLVLKQIININAAPPPIVWLTKGFDTETQLPLCETAKTLLGNNARYGALSGPSFASEVRQHLPTALALAVSHKQDFEWMQQCFHRPYLRIYYEADMVGLCVGGAVKNIIAIAAGVADGLALGNNARAALITRGLAEMASINRALGGGNESLQGLVGMGDLLLTCCSDLSRNRRLGLAIAEQKDEALSPARRESLLAAATSEGAAALSPVLACANKHGLPVPIIRAVNAVLNESLSPAAAVEQLLSRPPAAPQ